MSDRLYIFDTTLRDGEQVPGCQLNTVEKIQVAKQRRMTVCFCSVMVWVDMSMARWQAKVFAKVFLRFCCSMQLLPKAWKISCCLMLWRMPTKNWINWLLREIPVRWEQL